MVSDRDTFEAHVQALSTKALLAHEPLLHTLQANRGPRMSTCSGQLTGQPKLLSLSECAEACRQASSREVCEGFQVVYPGGMEANGEDYYKPLCFLYRSIKSVTRYECGKGGAGE